MKDLRIKVSDLGLVKVMRVADLAKGMSIYVPKGFGASEFNVLGYELAIFNQAKDAFVLIRRIENKFAHGLDFAKDFCTSIEKPVSVCVAGEEVEINLKISDEQKENGVLLSEVKATNRALVNVQFEQCLQAFWEKQPKKPSVRSLEEDRAEYMGFFER